ncbi:MAG: esterase [Rubrivivax sp.]
MRLALEWIPENDAPPPQLLVLLHGAGGRGALMRPLAEALRARFPRAAILAPDAPQPFDGGGRGRQWVSESDDSAPAVDALHAWLQGQQARLGIDAQVIALAGFAQGASLALELALRHDGAVGRVLAFGGRFARLPEAAPRRTTLHLLHGGADAVIPADHARQALRHLGVLHGDATLDIAQGVGHELHPALIDSALFRLTNHIPHRTWRAALGQVDPT